MSLIRRVSNPNFVVGVFLLVVLSILAGPNTLPRLIASLVPGFDEGAPCQWLRRGIDRAAHQSLIGRAARNPLSLSVRAAPLPATLDGTLVITITITNTSLGTVAIYYNPDQVRIGDDGVTSGLGLVFNAPNRQPAGQFQGGGVPESDIRLLGPRQSCVHRVEFPMTQLPDPTIATGSASVKAYYRNTSPGAQTADAQTGLIFADQGLWVGVVESEPVIIR